jgi:hypothetical protein
MLKTLSLSLLVLGTTLTSARAVDFLDQLGAKVAAVTNVNSSSSTLSVPLSQDQMVQGLKQALSNGVQRAVSQLGQTNGFLTNAAVRIPLPEKLVTAEKALRSMKQDQLVDNLVVTMNHAAEQAVPAAVSVFADALQQMSINDAKSLLTGSTNAATQYFRRTTETNLYAKFLPIVKSATKSNRVIDAYQALIAKAQQGTLGNLGGLTDASSTFGGLVSKGSDYLGKNGVDVDTYVTQKALDGLFKMVAEQERKIRENPAARTSELMQTVFGAVKK